MKKMILILSFMVSTFAIDSKTSKLTNDDTLASWDRKAILFTKDTGLQSRTIKLDINYCSPSGNRRSCKKIDNYIFKINTSLKNNSDIILYTSLIKNRYDKIIFTKSGATIITPATTISTKNSKLTRSTLNHSTKNKYENSINSFLNKVKQPIANILKSSINQRYENMKNKEKESFFTQKAKSSGIPVEFISSLMNSSYAFSIYSNNIQGSITIDKFYTKKNKPYYRTSVSLNNKSTLFINILQTASNPIKFIKYKNIDQDTSSAGSIKTNKRPTHRNFHATITKTIKSLYKNMATKYAYELVKDDNFAIIAPVEHLKDNNVYAGIGAMEDVRIDAPYIIRKTINGKVEETGFVKTRTVFDNAYKNGKSQKGNSKFSVIQGSANIVSSLKEHPWYGTFVGIGIGTLAFEIDNPYVKIQNTQGITISVYADLGYITNTSFLSEIWFLASMLGGVGENKNTQTFLTSSNISISKRVYLGSSGLYTALGFGAGNSFAFLDKFLFESKLGSIDIHARGELGLNIGVDNELSMYADYDIPVDTFMTYSGRTYDSYATIKRGLSFGLIYKRHMSLF